MHGFGRCAVIALLVVSAPTWVRGAETQHNLRIADAHIIPGYERLAQTTAALDAGAGAFCKQPDLDSLQALRSEFHQAMDAWQSIQHIRFGPVEFMMRNYRFDLWPDKRGSVGKHLSRLVAARDRSALEPERFATGSVAVQGFSALERLLFNAGVATSEFAPGPEGSFRCSLVQAITGNLSRMSAGLLRDWTQGDEAYRKYFATAAQGNAFYADERELGSRLLNSLHTQLQVVVEQKLTRPLGDSPERARPKRAESWRSGRALRNIQLNLHGTREAYRLAFGKRVAEPALNQAVESAFVRALQALDLVSVPLAKAVTDPDARIEVVKLRGEAGKLKALFSGPLPQSLDLPLGFNSLDGD